MPYDERGQRHHQEPDAECIEEFGLSYWASMQGHRSRDSEGSNVSTEYFVFVKKISIYILCDGYGMAWLIQGQG